MHRSPFRLARSAGAVVAAATVLLAVGAPAWCDEKPLDRLQGAIKNMQAQIKNASMKLKHTTPKDGQYTGGLTARTQRAVTRPAQICCSRNLEVMFDRMQTMAIVIEDLHARHLAANDQPAIDAVNHMAETFREMRKAYMAFAQASEIEYARINLESMNSTFSHFRRSTDRYVECCAAAAGSAPSGQTDEGAKKKKKKRKNTPKAAADAGESD